MSYAAPKPNHPALGLKTWSKSFLSYIRNTDLQMSSSATCVCSSSWNVMSWFVWWPNSLAFGSSKSGLGNLTMSCLVWWRVSPSSEFQVSLTKSLHFWTVLGWMSMWSDGNHFCQNSLFSVIKRSKSDVSQWVIVSRLYWCDSGEWGCLLKTWLMWLWWGYFQM